MGTLIRSVTFENIAQTISLLYHTYGISYIKLSQNLGVNYNTLKKLAYKQNVLTRESIEELIIKLKETYL